jgi:hypothetical protein
MFCIEGELLIA